MVLRRSRRINKQNSNDELTNSNVNEVILMESSTVRNKRKSKKKPNTKRKKQTRPSSSCTSSRLQHRPVTISLDVTDSESSNDSDGDVTELNAPPSSNKRCRISSPAGPRIENGRCVLDSDSDSNDAAIIPDSRPYQGNFSFDSDSEDDLYAVNYQEVRTKTFEAFEEELKSSKSRYTENERFNLCDSDITPTVKRKARSSENDLQAIADSPAKEDLEFPEDEALKLNLDNIDVSSIVLRGSTGKPRRNKKTKNAIASLEAFSKRLQHDTVENSDNSVLDVTDDIIVADNSNITIRLRWGTKYSRYTINERTKFATMYQEFAEKYNVSVSQVVLSFKDKVISPDDTPLDIGLTFGDLIEGGICNQSSSQSGGEVDSKLEDKDSLSLKVQTSNRKIVHTLSINKYDKLSLLMEKYAKLRNIQLENIKFKFDGDILQPSDTPSDLDLEGGECIDAFEINGK